MSRYLIMDSVEKPISRPPRGVVKGLFRGALVMILAGLLSGDLRALQVLSSFEAGADISQWQVVTAVGSLEASTEFYVTDQVYNGKMNVPLGILGEFVTIRLDLVANPKPPRAGEQYLAVDIYRDGIDINVIYITVYDGATGYTSDLTEVGGDNNLDVTDVLYIDMALISLDAPTSIDISRPRFDTDHNLHLDNLRYTDSLDPPDLSGTITDTRTHTKVISSTPTSTATLTATVSATPTASVSHTMSASRTTTFTVSITDTATPTATPTATRTITRSVTPTPTRTLLGTRTVTPTATPTPTITWTFTPEAAPAVVYPNPLYLSQHDKAIFGNLRQGDQIQIYTIAGEKVRHVKANEVTNYPGNQGKSVNNLRYGWDTRNDIGEPVVSGLYIAVIRHETGQADRVKIAIIRE